MEKSSFYQGPAMGAPGKTQGCAWKTQGKSSFKQGSSMGFPGKIRGIPWNAQGDSPRRPTRPQ
eukprot:1302425-Lingulodinium_polyedra.AAC.1